MRSGTSAAAKATAKARHRAVSFRRYCPISTCIYWTGYGSGGSCSNGLAHALCDTPPTLSVFVDEEVRSRWMS